MERSSSVKNTGSTFQRAAYDSETLNFLRAILESQQQALHDLEQKLPEALHAVKVESAAMALAHLGSGAAFLSKVHVISALERESAELSEMREQVTDLIHRIDLSVHQTVEAESSFQARLSQLVTRIGWGLSSPGFVAALRGFAATADGILAFKLAGLPALVALAVTSKRGPNLTAGTIAAPMVLAGDPVKGSRLSRVAQTKAIAPRTLAQLAARIPDSAAHSPQIRIENYGDTSCPNWIVYYAGTVQMSPNADGEPWDLTSNLTLMAANESASLEAVKSAMSEAGIEKSDHVLHVGFSQGGILAAELASRAPKGTADLVTFGAPIAHLNLEKVGGVVAVEHQEDLVPALAGLPSATLKDRLVISASAFDELPQSEEALPAHNLHRYAETISRVESGKNLALSAEVEKILGQHRGRGTSELWRADR